MQDLVEVIGYINNVLYVVLAIAAFRAWRRQGGEAAAWVAATFFILVVIATVGLFLPEEGGSALVDLVTKLLVIGIAFFPYALYRFTSAIKQAPRWADRIALVATLAVSVWTLFLGDLPEEGEPRSPGFQLFVVALLLQWGGLLITVAARLWRAGRGQPTLARRRMKLLSLASVGMTVTLIVAGTQTGGPEASVELATTLMTMLSVVFFYLAFAPPALVRMAWRRPEQEALRHATEQLIRATTEEEVIDSLLPHVTRTVGARGALLASSDGRTLGVHGEVGTAGDGSTAWDAAEEGTDLVSLELDFGRLVIWASPYTPFFGREELELLQSLGILTGLALDRTQLYQREKEARASLERANLELHSANVRLEESRASLAEAQSIAHIGSYASDLATGRTSWSAELYSIFGVDPESFVVDTESYYAHVHPDDRSRVEAIVAEAIAERRSYAFDHRVIRPDGEQRILHARGKVETDESGEPVRLVGTLQDVTAAREAERRIAMALASEREARRKLEELNAEMESFVYTVSHDLNSPIIAILGFAEFLEKDFASELPEKGRFYIERIRASAGYLQSLIKDLLAFSRVGRVQTESQKVELGPLVQQAADEVRAGCPGFRLHVGELPAVHMNPLRARQLFTNLMQNSCRYAGRPDVVVSVSSERDRGGTVQISVRDNGPGIPAKDRTKAFGVFERLQREGSSEGSGMGLPICKRIVETAGGSMWIEDSEQGLDLRFTLPLGPSEVVKEEMGEKV